MTNIWRERRELPGPDYSLYSSRPQIIVQGYRLSIYIGCHPQLYIPLPATQPKQPTSFGHSPPYLKHKSSGSLRYAHPSPSSSSPSIYHLSIECPPGGRAPYAGWVGGYRESRLSLNLSIECLPLPQPKSLTAVHFSVN